MDRELHHQQEPGWWFGVRGLQDVVNVHLYSWLSMRSFSTFSGVFRFVFKLEVGCVLSN